MDEEKTTLEILDQRVRDAENGKDAEGFAKAYQTIYQTETNDWTEAQKLDNEKSKNRTTLIVGILALVGSILTAFVPKGIDVAGDLIFQGREHRFEDAGAYANYRKHKR